MKMVKKISNAHRMMSSIVDDIKTMNTLELDELSDTADVSSSLLRHWKQGRVGSPQLRNFVAIAEALGYTVVMSCTFSNEAIT